MLYGLDSKKLGGNVTEGIPAAPAGICIQCGRQLVWLNLGNGYCSACCLWACGCEEDVGKKIAAIHAPGFHFVDRAARFQEMCGMRRPAKPEHCEHL